MKMRIAKRGLEKRVVALGMRMMGKSFKQWATLGIEPQCKLIFFRCFAEDAQVAINMCV
jgi:hypothetical protein